MRESYQTLAVHHQQFVSWPQTTIPSGAGQGRAGQGRGGEGRGGEGRGGEGGEGRGGEGGEGRGGEGRGGEGRAINSDLTVAAIHFLLELRLTCGRRLPLQSL